jgi:hypothetical protein
MGSLTPKVLGSIPSTPTASPTSYPPARAPFGTNSTTMSTFKKHGDLLIVALTKACLARAGLNDLHEGPIHQHCVIKPNT